ncbi:dipeptidase [Ovoidimarina sediminis]|uniref:dipeptidase n=1 Tax=Ovoidimarina sediminis TaxID=3079856 RepID=UPI00290BB110|nr:membrane dipeptidase [Rhodophyticola sp. MJ-SS7]MDU8946461.1 membrane dipeptidase [Rhodophyticola sp. MJ-SS7]
MRAIKLSFLWLGQFVAIALAAFFALGPSIVEQQQNTLTEHEPYEVSDEAQALHSQLIIADWHADTMLWKRDFLKRSSRGHVDLPRMQEGNQAIQVFAAVTKTPAGLNYEENSAEAFDNITALAVGQLWPIRTWGSLLERAIYQAEKLHRFAMKSDGQFRVITSKSELEAALEDRAGGANVTMGLLSVEGAHALEGDLANFERIDSAGFRIIGLHHFFDNELGSSLHGEGEVGLTDFGRQVVAEIERRGIVLDLAHSSPRVANDVLQMTDMPVVVSHTGIFSHCQTKRNFPDQLMKEVAKSGGVVGIGFWAKVTCDDSPEGIAGAIRAAVDLLGEDHVSLGSDWDGTVQVAMDPSELSALTQALVEASFTDEQIGKIMGGNFLRVVRERLTH